MVLISPEAEPVEVVAQASGPELLEQRLVAQEALAGAHGERLLTPDPVDLPLDLRPLGIVLARCESPDPRLPTRPSTV